MSWLRRKAADIIEETARSKKASSSASAKIGKTLKQLGVAGLMKWVAARMRPEVAEGDDA